MGWSAWLSDVRTNGLCSQLEGRQRRGASPRESLWNEPQVRRLEPRRVLNASVTNLLAPAAAVEGDTIVVAAEGTGEGDLQFDWSVTNGSDQVAEGSGDTFQFQAPDNGIYTVGLELIDGDATADAASTTIVVENVAPVLESADITAPDAAGGTATLSGTIVDPGTSDAVTLQVDWGGNNVQTVDLAPGERSFAIDHQTDAASWEAPYDATITLLDGDGGVNEAYTADGIAAGTVAGLTLQEVSMVNEGEMATLRMSFTDFSARTVLIDWGDSSPPQEVQLDGEQGSLVVGHLYSDDNPTATPEDLNQINVTVFDGEENALMGSTSVLVKNVGPEISFIDPVEPLEIGDTALLRFGFSDAGALDVHEVTIDWGDGTTTNDILPVGGRDATISHEYLAAPLDGGEQYKVQITVTDDDGQSGAGMTTIDVVDLGPMNLNVGPVSPINENGLATLNFSFTDTHAEATHTATVDWGDGQTNLYVLPVGDRNFTTTHRYHDDNPSGTTQDTYTINVTVDDGMEGIANDNTTVLVRNVAPTALVTELTGSVDEGNNAQLNVRFADEGIFDQHTVTIDWGDGNETTETLPVGTRDRTFIHTYQDDDPSETSEDTYSVGITVADDDGQQIAGEDTILVRNVAPSALVTELPSAVDEGASAQLNVGFADPGMLDVHTVTVDWGDGSTTAETLPVGARDRSFAHAYNNVEFDSSGQAAFDVTITVADDDGQQVVGQESILVNNTAPTALVTELTDMIDEGNLASLDVRFADENVFDQHTVTIDWGDGNVTTETPPVGARDLTFQHQYLDDNPTATSEDVYAVQVTVDDGQGSISASDSILVKNVAPSALVTDITEMVDEHDQALLNVRFADAGILDEHTVTIDWGDGTTTVETLPVGARDSTFAHQYLDDDPTLTAEDEYTVAVTVTDDDGGSVAGTNSILVRNVAPEISVMSPTSADEGQLVEISSTFTDVGTLDQHTATIDWGDGTQAELPVDQQSGGGSFQGSHIYADDGTYTVSITLSDDDLGVDNETITLTVENVSPTIAPVPDVEGIPEGSLYELPPITFSDPEFAGANSNEDAGGNGTTGPISNQVDFPEAIIDWGDGSTGEFPNELEISFEPGGPNVPTVGAVSGSHVYADDGTYEVTVTLLDDDGGAGTTTFQVSVVNVAPTMQVIDDQTVDVGEMFELENLATFSDPGFDNPGNPNEQPGGSQEMFVYQVLWGDGNSTMSTPQIDQAGSASVPTLGSIDAGHRYLRAGEYTVTVFLADDDMLAGSISSSLAGSDDPTSQGKAVPDFVTGSFTITVEENFFIPFPSGPDNDDPEVFYFDFSGGGGRFDLSAAELAALNAPQNGSVELSVLVPDLRALQEELAAQPDRFLVLQVIEVDGSRGDVYRVDPKALLNLREFFSALPDNEYAVYVVQPDLPDPEDWRLVVRATVRGGQAVDATDESDGAQEKPPTEQPEIDPEKPQEFPSLEVVPGSFAPGDANGDENSQSNVQPIDAAVQVGCSQIDTHQQPVAPVSGSALPPRFWEELAAVDRDRSSGPYDVAPGVLLPTIGLAATSAGRSWSRRIRQALAQKNEAAWRRLDRSGRLRRQVLGRNRP